MGKQLKKIPDFRSEDEEREFWATKGRDSTQYLDWSKARLARFPNLKPSTQTISLRLPVSVLDRIKIEANKRDVPYQALIKIWLADKVEAPNRLVGCELRTPRASRDSKRLVRGEPRGN